MIRRFLFSASAILFSLSVQAIEVSNLYISHYYISFPTLAEASYVIEGIAGLEEIDRSFNGSRTTKFVRATPEDLATGITITEDGSEIVPTITPAMYAQEIFGVQDTLYAFEASFDLTDWDTQNTFVGNNATIRASWASPSHPYPTFFRFRETGTAADLPTGFAFLDGKVSRTAAGDLVIGEPADGVSQEGAIVRIPALGKTASVFEGGSFFANGLPTGTWEVVAEQGGDTFKTWAIIGTNNYVPLGKDWSTAAAQVLELVNGIEVNGVSLDPPPYVPETLVLGHPELVPANTQVKLQIGGDTGNFGNGLKPNQDYWLFRVDLFPHQGFPHPVYYVTITEFGAIEVIQATSKAEIGGIDPFFDIQANDRRILQVPTVFSSEPYASINDGGFPTELLPRDTTPIEIQLQLQNVAASTAAEDDPILNWGILYSVDGGPAFGLGPLNIKTTLGGSFKRLTLGGSVATKQDKMHLSFKEGLKQIVAQYNSEGMNGNDRLFIYVTGHHDVIPKKNSSSNLSGGRITVSFPEAIEGDRLREDYGNQDPVEARQILSALKVAESCHLFVYLDTCLAQSLLYPTPYTAEEQKSTRARNGKGRSRAAKTFSELAPRQVPTGKELLVIGTSSHRKSAKVVYRWKPFGAAVGPQATNEAISNGVIGKDGAFTSNFAKAIQAHDNSVLKDDTHAKKQGASLYYLSAIDPDACDRQQVDILEDPEDPRGTTSTAAFPVNVIDSGGDGDETQTTLIGSASAGETDYFVLDIPELVTDGSFVRAYVADGDPFRIIVEDDVRGPLTLADWGIIDPADHPDGKVVIGVKNTDEPRFPTPPIRYTIVLENEEITTAIILKNVSESRTYAMEVVTTNAPVNEAAFIVLSPGETYREYFSIPLTGFNILNFHDLSNPNPIENDQGLSVRIGEGTEQVFNFGDGVTQFFDAPIFSN